MIVGVTAGSFAWRDLEEAFSLAIDACGFDLIEFDTAQLGPEGVAQLGLLTQRFGASIGLHTSLDRMALTPDHAAVALNRLCEQCEDALAQYARVSFPGGAIPESGGSLFLDAVLPAYKAAGIRLFIPLTPGAVRIMAQSASAVLSVWLDADRDAAEIRAFTGAGIDRVGCVRIAIGDALEEERAESLRGLPGLGFRGPYLLASGVSSGSARLRSCAERLREILGGAE